LAATGEPLAATHLSFPSVCHVAVAGERSDHRLTYFWTPRATAGGHRTNSVCPKIPDKLNCFQKDESIHHQ
jgi:hypothetical protein